LDLANISDKKTVNQLDISAIEQMFEQDEEDIASMLEHIGISVTSSHYKL
jgi:hypothetical protein